MQQLQQLQLMKRTPLLVIYLLLQIGVSNAAFVTSCAADALRKIMFGLLVEPSWIMYA
jgi:hypothetical protein